MADPILMFGVLVFIFELAVATIAVGLIGMLIAYVSASRNVGYAGKGLVVTGIGVMALTMLLVGAVGAGGY